jgi:hypothetical protein
MSIASPPRRKDGQGAPSRVLVFGGAALVGAAVWGAWLGWDTSYYRLPDDPSLHGPHTSGQVLACALTIGLVTALLSRWRNPVAVAAGVTFGFWVVWTAAAAADVDSGPSFWPIGSALLLCGLVTGTGLTAALGYAVRSVRRPHGGQRVPSPDQPSRQAPVRRNEHAPPDRWRTGAALVLVGLCWLLIGSVMRLTYPLTWTYLRVLHIPLDVAAVAAVAYGIVLAVVAARRRRADRISLRPLAPAMTGGAVLLAVVLVARVVPAGDGFNGQVGVMAGPDGSPVVVLGVCRGEIDTVIVEDRESDLGDRFYDHGEGAYAARLQHEDGVNEVTAVDLTSPPAGWSGTTLRPSANSEDELYVEATGRGAVLDVIWFTRAEVERLPPDTVLLSTWDDGGAWAGSEQVQFEDVATVACAEGRTRNGR